MTERETLSIFIRHPSPGTVKPRLITALGQEGAASLQREITEHIVSSSRAFIRRERPSRGIEIRYSGASETVMQSWLGAGIRFAPQGNGDPGDRMIHAFNDAFDAGAEAVVVLGVDCPGVSESHLYDAFTALRRADVVIGPSRDGGYYLIGIRREVRFIALPAVFTGIAWGTGYAFGDTLTAVRRLGLSFQITGRLEEVDHPDDLPIWERIRAGMRTGNGMPIITAVVPTLNNAIMIDTVLDRLLRGDGIEIIIADAGSTDDTVFRAIARGISVVHAPGNAAAQLDAGIIAGTGEYVFITPPGAIPGDGFDDIVRDTLADSSVACGLFTRKNDSPQWVVRSIHRIVKAVSSLIVAPDTKDGLFFRTFTLSRAGGVQDIPGDPYAGMIRRFRRLGQVAVIPVRSHPIQR